jgi:hypothetical protein
MIYWDFTGDFYEAITGLNVSNQWQKYAGKI